ncbi:MAG: hypothetical protein AB7G75_02660 [Candidatus Binatia bacterium]
MTHNLWIWMATLGMGLLVSLNGCAAMRRADVHDTEDLLAAAGFHMKLVDTPEKVARLNNLPPLKLRVESTHGKVLYSYADPDTCHCVYVGGPEEYSQFKRLALEKHIADEQLQAAQVEESAAADWRIWGPLWW